MGLGFILAMFIIGFFFKDLFKVFVSISLVVLFYFHGIGALEIIFNSIVNVITYLKEVFV